MSPLKCGGHRRCNTHKWWALSDLNGRPFGCKPNALTAELSALTQSIVQEASRTVNALHKHELMLYLFSSFSLLRYVPWTAFFFASCPARSPSGKAKVCKT